jgi:hypothetical protein
MDAPGPDQKLKLEGDSYYVYVHTNDMAVGTVQVTGHRITFSGSNTCDGAGTYRWRVTNGSLEFKRQTADPCPRRMLLRHSWSRQAQ